MQSCTRQDGRGQAGQNINEAGGDVRRPAEDGTYRGGVNGGVSMMPPSLPIRMLRDGRRCGREVVLGGGSLKPMFAFGKVAGCRHNLPLQFVFNRDLHPLS